MPLAASETTVNVTLAREVAHRFVILHVPFMFVVHETVVELAFQRARTTTPARGISASSCALIVTRASHRLAVIWTLTPSRSPTWIVAGGGGGGGGGGGSEPTGP